ncbi:MAG: S1 RNA-binding domain-containing protein [Patescibacteria group bacterium]|nr:S1 RNA-binding domain-containing protein [Patescibacteria group bacterium]MDD5490861.1 S1 RNA-binding domain-containing protein [Patescibacteria group bacterium]
MKASVKNKKATGEMEKMLDESGDYLKQSTVGEIVKGTVISASGRAVHVDLGGLATGIIRGRELLNNSKEYGNLKPGDEVEATVLEKENENGEVELSFRYAGHRKAWDNAVKFTTSQEATTVKVVNANKGGLMITFDSLPGFLPVSQLIAEHYPRVQGGDKNKILEKLKELIGQDLKVKILDANEKEEKLIVSEKAAWEEEQKAIISQYKVGDMVEGEVTAVTDFGVFIKFENLEGLIHISELAWQRIDDPRELVRVGEKVKAEIINIENSKIFLSMKKLKDDPWKNVAEKYKVGEKVKGKVLKINPFGLFVELDRDIHGLAHISELSTKTISSPEEVAKPGDVLEFKIVSLEPKDHRLGLSIKALKEKPKAKKEDKEDEKKDAKEEKETPAAAEEGKEKEAEKNEAKEEKK